MKPDQKIKLNFSGDLAGLEAGLPIACARLGLIPDRSGRPVQVIRGSGRELRLEMTGDRGRLSFGETHHFFRGLGLLAEKLRETDSFAEEQTANFRKCGAMLDLSRNTVMRVESLQRYLEYMALMGLNLLMLYLEDLYELPGEPYFGYLRGRYSRDELKAVDDYAAQFGIEVVPCIQTLGHMEQFLKWAAAEKYADAPDSLLPDSPDVHALIENLLRAASSPFRSREICIGMDEAHGLGLGRYLALHGYRDRFAIMNDHLKKVLEIARKLGLKAYMAPDMFFSLASAKRDYYDPQAQTPPEVIANMPADVTYCCWDYYHADPAWCEAFVRKHQEFPGPVAFAGGVWTWCGFGTNYAKTFLTTNSALTVCKRLGIDQAFATMWLDDGSENNFFSGLLGLQLFAEHGFCDGIPSEALLRQRFLTCTGASAEDFQALTELDAIPGTLPGNKGIANPSRYLLWQDLLLGLFDRHVAGLPVAKHYAELEKRLCRCERRAGALATVFEVPVRLCAVLALKSEVGLRLREMYLAGNRAGLRQTAENLLPKIRHRASRLRECHRRQWLSLNKPFGWEVMDIRYGGLLARLDSARQRLLAYADGEIDRIEELEEERLPFRAIKNPEAPADVLGGRYARIVTSSSIL